MPPLDSTARRALRARAHHLHPVVSVGQHGLTPAVLREIDVALKAHELIKVRVFGDDRDAREALLAEICAATDAAPVQHLGKLLVIWRPNPDAKPESVPRARPAKRAPTRKAPARNPREAGTARKPQEAIAARKPHGKSAARKPRDAPPAGVPRAALPRRRRARA